MRYKQLTQEERYQIHAYMKAGFNQSEIALEMNRNQSTISRKILRNIGLRGYRPQQAQRLTDERRESKSDQRIHSDTWQIIETLIRFDWSPEQISLWLKSFASIRVSHEWMYQHILKNKTAGGVSSYAPALPENPA